MGKRCVFKRTVSPSTISFSRAPVVATTSVNVRSVSAQIDSAFAEFASSMLFFDNGNCGVDLGGFALGK